MTFSVVNHISFSPLDQQFLRFSPLLDHITEMTFHLFKSVQFDFDDGHLISGFGIELLLSFDIAKKEPTVAFEINKPRPLYVL